VRQGETVNISVKAEPGVDVKVKIYNLTGELLRTMEYTTSISGWNKINWDVKNEAGNYVGRGLYFVYIIREDTGAAVRRLYVVK